MLTASHTCPRRRHFAFSPSHALTSSPCRFRTVPLSHFPTFSLSHLLTLALCLPAWAAPQPESRPASQPASQPAGAPETLIRVARSQDGLAFTDTGEIFLRNAAAPDLIRLPKGELLAIFDSAPDGPEGSLLAVSRSDDDGRSWSQPRPVRLSGLDRRFVSPRHGDLLWMSDGTLRLYFAASPATDERRREEKANEKVLILSATTRNGQEFQCDPDMRLELDGIPDAHPTTARINKRVHLYAEWADAPSARQRAGLKTNHWVSADARRFEPSDPVRLRDTLLFGNIVAADKIRRAYLTNPDGLCCLTTPDGREFKPERDLKLKQAIDPATVHLKDGSWLMLYCTQPDERSGKLPQLADAPATHNSASTASPQDQPVETVSSETPSPGEQPAVQADAAAGRNAEPLAWETFPTTPFEIDGETLTPPSPSGHENAAYDPSDAFPPMPDFVNKVDYAQWMREQHVAPATDNAWYAYQLLIDRDKRDEPDPNQPVWDALGKVMLGSPDFKGPPRPWDPADHPDWAAALNAGADYMDIFRQATWHADYARIPSWGPGNPEGSIIEMLLPDLSRHRCMVRATLSDAWRMENGQVSPDRMLSALDTCLRGAGHQMKGLLVIESLVGVAERNMIEQTARQALAQNIFSTPEEIAAAYTTLSQLDTDEGDPSNWLRGEYAACMDVTQRLFTRGSDGRLRVDPEGLNWFTQLVGSEVDEAQTQALANMGPDDAQKTVEAFDQCFRETADQVRAGDYDTDRTAMKYEAASPVVHTMLPSLSRAYEIRRRAQTSRRATQLAYAVHLYRAQTGSWPASLADLPAEFGAEIRTDPYTNGYFGYRVTESGPLIYSLSANGQDDGGIHSPKWGDNSDGGSDDYVFWPPQ